MQATKTLYKIRDIVPEDGMYLCVPCGFVEEFRAGEEFPTCRACYAGTSEGPEDFTEPHSEFWERFA